MTKLFNTSDDTIPADAIKIGRGSLWNSPFRAPFDGDRADILAKHERWLAEHPDLLRGLDELRGRDLACDCAASPCHGDTLLRLAALRRDERLAWARALTEA